MKKWIALLLAAALTLVAVSALAVDGKDLSLRMVDKSYYLEQVSTRRCTFQCKYQNTNNEKAVSGFDLAYVAMDGDFNVTMDETTHIDLNIQPGDERIAPTIYITNQEEMVYLVLAVQTVYFADGTSETIDFASGEDYNSYAFQVID